MVSNVSNVSAVAYIYVSATGVHIIAAVQSPPLHGINRRTTGVACFGSAADGRDTSGKQRSVSEGGSISAGKCGEDHCLFRRGLVRPSVRPSVCPLAFALASWFILAVDGLRIVWVRSSKHHSLPSLSHGVAEPISNMLQVKR